MKNLLTQELKRLLQEKALDIRIDSVRATTASKSGHPTTCLSAADIIATLFFHEMRYDFKNPKAANNDRFILSKGHAVPVVYAAYKALGVITDQDLLSLRNIDSIFEGHPTPRFVYNEAATGSLGQGLGIGVGMALNARHEKLDYHTYVMMGDGEISEGSIWEAADLAAHYKLDNLIGIVDCNRLGQTGSVAHDHDVQGYANKFTAFGWRVHVIDGHDFDEIFAAFDAITHTKDTPTMIIAKTYKGYGLKSIQDKVGYHGKPFTQDELGGVIADLQEFFGLKWEPENNKPAKITYEKIQENKQVITLDLTQDKNTGLFDKNKKMATRKAYGYALAALGHASKDVFALDADVKNSTYTEIFEKEFPERTIQCFIAEQNMVSVATGLQARGKIAFAATFGAFLTRAHDQIRMAGIGRNALRLCGSHCGVSIGEDGPSQMALEDISMMRAIPDSIVLYPSDAVCAYKLTELMANYHAGISFLRTTRAELPVIYDKNEDFVIGGCKVLKQSKQDKACIVAAGITLYEALKAYEILKAQDITVSVIDLYSVKPLDTQTLRLVAEASGNKIITVEDHYPEGGIGEAVKSALANEA
ncbi:MAG: transketolase, partial [bacterium]